MMQNNKFDLKYEHILFISNRYTITAVNLIFFICRADYNLRNCFLTAI